MSVIVHNMLSANANRQYGINTEKRAKSSKKLASGYKINTAADNAAGLTISEGMRAQSRGLKRGALNSQDGISLLKVGDGALAEVHQMLHRMTELTVQAANDTNTYEDRERIQEEINQLRLEITRIGQETEFNTIKIFDSEPTRVVHQDINLVSSPSEDTGYMTEATKIGTRYYPSSSLDFSAINKNSIKLLYNKSFTFTCSQSCDETFKFTFINGDGTQSRVEGQDSGRHPHIYYIDIHGLTSGQQIVDKTYDFISNNMPNSYAPAADSLPVSHSNKLYKNGSVLNVVATVGYGTEEQAKNKFAGATGAYGKVDASEITGSYSIDIGETILHIQGGANTAQAIEINLFKMNSTVLGLDELSVEDYEHATVGLSLIQNAVEKVSYMRTDFGAKYNRLEHTYDNALNSAENLQVSESRMRDTEMADEMVEFSKDSILMQVGEAMISQAKQSQEGVVSLLR